MEKDYKWDLSKLYESYDSDKYVNDFKKLSNLIEELNKIASSLKDADPVKAIEAYLHTEEEINILVENLYNYSALQTECDVNDSKSAMESAKVFQLLEGSVGASVKFSKFIKKVNVDKVCQESSFLNQYKWNLKNIKKEAKHKLSDKEEIILAKYEQISGNAWSNLQSKLTSNLSIRVKGFDKAMPLAQVRNLAYSSDETVRKNCYKAELRSYKKVEDSVAEALSNIKKQANINASLRGYKSVLDMTLKNSHMKEKTLNALIEAINDRLPYIRKYFKLKGEALGHKNGLPFYDLFAPMGSLTKTYTIEEAYTEVLGVYKSFSDPLYESAKRAMDNNWIDVYPREGKVGGAFCAYIPAFHESRVLTNFTGSLSDVQTLAHELGHAYHGYVMSFNPPLSWEHPMQLAETASTFCQILMTKKMLNDFEEPQDKLTLLEYSLCEDTQVIVDILCRYLFETKVVNSPLEAQLSSSDLCKMMLDSQDESYGDGLDPKYKHPYMWLCKGHYYSAGLNFYNWPYAFGMLYARGLYALYLKDKDTFVKNYDQMLKNTCMMDVEDVAASMGIDITKKSFWLSSIKQVEDDILEFETLLRQTGKIK